MIVPDLRPAIDGGPPYYPRLVSTIVSAVTDGAPLSAAEPIVLVGHSRAGPILPAMAAAIGERTEALLFVDSRLPSPGRSWFDGAPPSLAGQLRAMAVGGRVPPWHEWFGPEALTMLVPDEQTRARFVAEVPRLPLAYLEEPLPETTWSGPSGHLQLSAAYAEASTGARALGWRVAEFPADHLAPLTRPGGVAEVLIALHELVAHRR